LPAYIAIGNHDVGYVNGGDEQIAPEDLYGTTNGEDITKAEFLAVTKMPGRYFAFDMAGYHFIVLDTSNSCAARPYYLDEAQIRWLEQDLSAHRAKTKIVFSHVPLHSYPTKEWDRVRDLFAADGNVPVCFSGHKHYNSMTWTNRTAHIMLAATHVDGSYARITLTGERVAVEGTGIQKDYDLPVTGAILPPKASAEFDHRYGAAALPDPAAWAQDVIGKPGLAVDGRTLRYDSTSDGDAASWSARNWPPGGSGAFTVEIRARVNASAGPVLHGGIPIGEPLDVYAGAGPQKAGVLIVDAHKTWWYVQETKVHLYALDTGDNTNGYHTFRIACDGQDFHLWRDGVEIGRYFPGYFTDAALRFGDIGSAGGGNVDIDYVRYDTSGAYAPP
jgi:hypothetical protein